MDSGFDFWGAALTPSKVVKCTVKDALLHVTSICLGESVQNKKERSIVSVTHGGRSYVIASLREGVCEQVTIDLVFKENEEFRFKCTGSTPVHLVGYVQPISDDDLNDDDDEDDEKFEDEVIAPQLGQKRPMPQDDESSSEAGDSDSDEATEEQEQQPPVKKAKSEPVPEPMPVEVETPKKSKTQLKRERKAAQAALKSVNKVQPETPKSALEELNSGHEASEEEEQPSPAQTAQSEPEPKPVEVETPKKSKTQLKRERKAAQALKAEQPETPISAKKVQPETPKSAKKVQPETPKSAKKVQPETPKSAKKVQPETPKSAKKEAEFKKLAKGLLAKDVEIGHGKEAKKGSRCGMFYTGRLKNGKVFDSNTKSKKPFVFKLGAGQVISGWEIGVAGMKVGGKRLLVVPPKLGYGAQGAGSDIPPNAVLVFEIELARVN